MVKRILKHIFKLFPKTDYFKRDAKCTEQIFTGASKLMELEYGHLISKQKQQSINGKGEPIPWITYPALDYLSQLDLKEKIMLEWGAGNSSWFFSTRVKHLYSIEHNRDWFEQVKKYNLKNHTLFYEEKEYSTAPKELNLFFDIILIDGIKRDECSLEAYTLLKKGGLIILDNSDRHPLLAKEFREKNLIQIDFHGLGPINDYTWTTSLFLDRNYDFQPLGDQPTIPKGGGF